MSKQQSITSQHRVGHRGSVKAYTIGFTLSVILTLAAYILVKYSIGGLSSGLVVFIIIGLAVAQLAVQLQFFIHLGRESKPGWNKVMFVFMALVVLIVAIGSLWIMSNLHYNRMSPGETETHLLEEEGYKR